MNTNRHSAYSSFLALLYRVYSEALNNSVPDSPAYNKLYRYWLKVRDRLMKAMYNYK